MQVELGTVLCPSGVLLVVDPGYLKMWSHDAAPVLPDGVLSSEEATARANGAVDLQLVGRDAEQVGRTFDRSWHPLFIYDIPRDDVPELETQIAELARSEGLDARLEVLAERVSHRRRLDLALEHGRGAGEISFHGIWAAVVGDVPPGPLRVVAEAMPPGTRDAERLHHVAIVARETAVARSEPFAHVAVDWARLVAVDAQDVGSWRDGPLMEQVRASPAASGTVALGEGRACGFMTTWGDGIFEVHRDLDADGRLVQIRIDLGTEKRQALMRRMELRWSTSALVSRKVLDEGLPVRFMYRESPAHDSDSGWRMMSGFEADEDIGNPASIAVVRASEFASMDKRVDALLDQPVGAAFERVPGEAEFRRVTDVAPPRG